MDQQTPSDDRKPRVLQAFNTIAAAYDGLRFTRDCARRIIELADLQAGGRVLDLATGTGMVALLAAELVGPRGQVVGVDFSSEMLARARHKGRRAGLRVDFREGDAARLALPDNSFDVVLCASSLFFVPDRLAAARECLRVLKPGGFLLFSSFGMDLLNPLRSLWDERLARHDLRLGTLPMEGLADAESCENLLREAGFVHAQAHSEDLGYFLGTSAERWKEIEAGLESLPLERVPPEQRKKIKAEHLAELEAYRSPQGFRVEVPAIFARGEKVMG